MMLARMEPALEIDQPEEQHRFRKSHRIEEQKSTPPFFFFPLRPFLAAEGPLTQGCCTGQPPGTDCFYTGQSRGVLVVGKVAVQTPDLPLPGWEATDRHGARVRKEVAERWKVSVVVVVGKEIFEQQAGRKGSSYRMGKES